MLLPCERASAWRARRFVRQALLDAGRPEWVDAAELACSEIVTNAVLHAHTQVQVTVRTAPDHVRVEVRDFNPVLPVQRDYSKEATTGRGMTLVAALADAHGITDAGPAGKTIWFTVSSTATQQSEDELLAAWDDADWHLDDLDAAVRVAAGDASSATVRFLALPPALWLAARQHHDALIRELSLYLAQHDVRGVDVAAADRARAIVSTAVVAAVERSQSSSTTSLEPGEQAPCPEITPPLDLALPIAPELGPAFDALRGTLDAAEGLAASGRLLARPGLPEIIAVRNWACDQVTAQLGGRAATPWPGTDDDRFTTAVHTRTDDPEVAGNDVAFVRDSERGCVASDAANRILAISRPLADALGWDPDALLGRRVVTLVPPALREAHVAAFSRATTTGEHRILDVPLTLPVLHRDGSEISCSFLLRRTVTPTGGAIYVAWIDPIEDQKVHPAS